MIRIELYNATEDDYEILHKAMVAEGFSRIMIASDAVYTPTTKSTPAQVLDSVNRAAGKTGKNYVAIVSG